MKKAIPYATLKKLLEGLRFQEAVLPSGHVVLSYAKKKGWLLVYRAYRPEEVLDWADVAKTRRFLVEWGLIEEDSFDRLLQEPAA